MNKYIKANKIKCRVKLMNIEHQPCYLSSVQIQAIKDEYPLPQWCYQFAKLQYELGYLDEYHSDYVL